MPRWLAALAAAIAVACAGVLVAAFLIVDLGESAGIEEGVTLRQVAERPADFAGQEVAISGEIAENDYFSLADADVVLAIGDDAEGQVLVYPQPGASVPDDLSESSVLRVEGTVRVVEPQAADAEGFVDRAGLLAASDATAVIEATRVELAADNRNAPPAPEPVATVTTITRLLADPGDFGDGPVVVPGRVATVLPSGFVLAHQGERIFVGAPASDLDELGSGEEFRVRGELARLSRFRANAVAEALAASSREGDPGGAPEPGDRFLVLRALLGPAEDPAESGPDAETGAIQEHAREGETLRLGGLEYRVTMFRQLNPRIAPDRALIDIPPPDDHGYFAAFLTVCNTTEAAAAPTSRVHLENAFGTVYEPVEPRATSEFAYGSEALEPGRCLPAEGSVSDDAFPGAAIVFEVPIDDLGERPFLLELRDADAPAQVRRVELDL